MFDPPAAATAISTGQLDADWFADIVLAIENQVVALAGRDRGLAGSDTTRSAVREPRIYSVVFDEEILSVIAGRFYPGHRHQAQDTNIFVADWGEDPEEADLAFGR